ncbi:MAG: 4-hydroxy-3-methylbut-2-enyl diphosphate reductase [Candidatus Omnitrophica bacterium]|nr:4-hydroxy-3-methylbut-2-enyl diphosphate reductase [Candidatus Omnitrophota bacterium]
MKINLAESAGFCFGVKRALKIALELARSGEKVEMLGDIVHNEDVVEGLKKAGLSKIKKLGPGKGKTLLIRAHGACMATINLANQLKYKIVDATCPMVKEIHRIVTDMEYKGSRIIIIGDKNHDEVHGIAGQITGKAIIIDPQKPIPLKEIRGIEKAAAVVQSTQQIEKTLEVAGKLERLIKTFEFFNTICTPTTLKQQEIKVMPLENDVMIIIGSKKSANTKRLFEIARKLNKKTYWIESKGELKFQWFKGARSVGIASGASTPDSTTREIIETIEKQQRVLNSP